MSKRIAIKTLLAENQPRLSVKVCGWVRSVRRAKEVSFIALNDGSCFASLQLVVEPQLLADLPQGLGTGACLSVRGELIASPAEGQSWELQVAEVELLGGVDEAFPLQKKRHSFEFLRSIAHLRPRSNSFGAVFRMRSQLSFAVHQFFHQRNFVHVHTPIITANDCEGAGEMFRVTTLDPQQPPQIEAKVDWSEDFFGARTGLTVSGQLQGELFATAFSDIYTFGPTFRAENSNTSRHASEFWMIEPEMAFCDLAGNCDLAEDFLRHMVGYTLEHCAEDLDFFDQRIEKGLINKLQGLYKAEFHRVSYTRAVEQLQTAGQNFEFPVNWGSDLQSEHERYLTEKIYAGPVFVTDYPKEIKAFYMRDNDDGKTVAAMDLLVPRVGEIIGGSQREERFARLQQKMAAQGIAEGDLDWYLDIRRWGSCPHAGFGLGFERLLMYLTGMENIRDVIPFPRTPGHADF